MCPSEEKSHLCGYRKGLKSIVTPPKTARVARTLLIITPEGFLYCIYLKNRQKKPHLNNITKTQTEEISLRVKLYFSLKAQV